MQSTTVDEHDGGAPAVRAGASAVAVACVYAARAAAVVVFAVVVSTHLWTINQMPIVRPAFP